MKWKYYARKLYWTEFGLLLILVGLFLGDIFWLHYNSVDDSTKRIAGNIMNSIMAMILIRFTLTEID